MNTRQQILDATEGLIREKGLARVTTKEIAKAAGVAEGTLYNHFARKEDLFLAVLLKHLPDFVEVMSDRHAGVGSVSDNLKAIAFAVIDYYEQIVPLGIALFADTELLIRLRAVEPIREGGPQRFFAHVAAYIEAEQALGRINHTVRPLSGAALLLGPCLQFVFLRQFLGTNPLPVSKEHLVDGLVYGLMTGLAPTEN